MIKSSKTKRIYGISDAVLVQTAENFYQSAIRDVIEMEKYGFTGARLVIFNENIREFIKLPQDKYYVGKVSIAVNHKAQLFEKLSVECERFARRVANKFGKKSSEYKSINLTAYHKSDEANKVQKAQELYAMATSLFFQLAEEGFTTAMLENFSTAIAAVQAIKTAKVSEASVRDAEQINRIKKGNALYTELVKLADTGKAIWANKDAAKYDDYVLYKKRAKKTT